MANRHSSKSHKRRHAFSHTSCFWQEIVYGLDRLATLIEWAEVRQPREASYQETRQECKCAPLGRFCFVCNGAREHRHHIIQVQHGGTNDRSNLVWLCVRCHEKIHPWMVDPKIPPGQFEPIWHGHVSAPVIQPGGDPFVVTLDWLHAHGTRKGAGWTVRQLKTLGVTWPAHKGWLKKLAGTTITQAQRLAFETAKNITADAPRLVRRKTTTTISQFDSASHSALDKRL